MPDSSDTSTAEILGIINRVHAVSKQARMMLPYDRRSPDIKIGNVNL